MTRLRRMGACYLLAAVVFVVGWSPPRDAITLNTCPPEVAP